jgi:hypothetical protein
MYGRDAEAGTSHPLGQRYGSMLFLAARSFACIEEQCWRCSTSVAKTTFWAGIEPRGVEIVHELEEEDLDVTSVWVCTLRRPVGYS